MIKSSSGRGPLVLIDGKEVRRLTEMSSDAYLDFCILLGTDASPRIPSVGPALASRLMQKYQSIEELLDGEPKHAAKVGKRDEFMGLVGNARRVFRDLPPIPKKEQLKPKPAEGTAEEWLLEQHGIDFREDLVGGTLEGGANQEMMPDEGDIDGRDFGFADMEPPLAVRRQAASLESLIRDDDLR